MSPTSGIPTAATRNALRGYTAGPGQDDENPHIVGVSKTGYRLATSLRIDWCTWSGSRVDRRRRAGGHPGRPGAAPSIQDAPLGLRVAVVVEPEVSVLEKKPTREGERVLLVVLFVVYLALLAWIAIDA